MRGLKKLHGKGSYKQTDTQTSRLTERICLGADSLKNYVKVCKKNAKVFEFIQNFAIYHLNYRILRCIRPPKSQSRTNNLLKTSMCADWSQHLHETNRINVCYTKSLRKLVLEDIFIFLCIFGIISCLKTLCLDFHQENFFVTPIFRCLSV